MYLALQSVQPARLWKNMRIISPNVILGQLNAVGRIHQSFHSSLFVMKRNNINEQPRQDRFTQRKNRTENCP